MKYCLILDKEPFHARMLGRLCTDMGFEVLRASSLAEARDAVFENDVAVAFIEMNGVGDGLGTVLLDDGTLDDVYVMFMAKHDSPRLSNLAVSKGASYFFCKPFNVSCIAPILQDIAGKPNAVMVSIESCTPVPVDQFGYLRGSSKEMHKMYSILRKVSRTDASLMILGETGTGKELVAQSVHALSARSAGPLIAFNCATMAESLAESELFGHEKGSFSGAYGRHHGFFEQANGGTMFLDEITEMDIKLQAKLLRVLDTQKVRRIGAEEDISINVRFVSATNLSPEQAVRDGKLREDLYYRLAQFPVCIPPLRQRGGDIEGLAQYFLKSLNEKHKTDISFAADALEILRAHDWPGNVRELKHYVERAYILSEYQIEASILPGTKPELKSKAALADGKDMIGMPVGSTLGDMERMLIEATLERNAGDKRLAAVELGVSLKTIYNRLNAYKDQSENVDYVDIASSRSKLLTSVPLSVIS